MWNLLISRGEKLPDLLVVLAITVVLAAVLLPAVTNSQGNGVSAESDAVEERALMDGLVGSKTAPMPRHVERYQDDEHSSDEMVFVETATDSSTIEPAHTMQATGLKEMRTTDINYVIP